MTLPRQTTQSKGQVLKQAALAETAERKLRIEQLKLEIKRAEAQLSTLQSEVDKDEEEAELRRLEIQKTRLEVKKLRWDLRMFRAKVIVLPITILTAGLKMLSPSPVSTSIPEPTALREKSNKTGISMAGMSVFSMGTVPLNERTWISGRFHEKFRPFVDTVEKLYDALTDRKELKELLEQIDRFAERMSGEDADALDTAAALVVNELRNKRVNLPVAPRSTIRDYLKTTPLDYKSLPVFVPQKSPALSPPPPRVVSVLREAALARLDGAEAHAVKDRLHNVCTQFLASNKTQLRLVQDDTFFPPRPKPT